MKRRDPRARLRRLQRRPRLESLESRSLLAADFTPLQNPFDQLDVNDDLNLTPADALAVIDCLNGGTAATSSDEPMYPDVNGDRELSALDALMVVNHLNGQDASGELRAARVSAPTQRPELPIASLDGSGNNVGHPDFGRAGQTFLRGTSSDYGDGISTPAGADRPSARTVSNSVMSQDGEVPNARLLSNFIWQWGQFLDHDLDLTDSAVPSESFPIAVPQGDAYFDPQGSGTQTIGLSRSAYDPHTGDAAGDPRQQLNSISAFIDGSMVYGSDTARATGLRTLSGGRLRTSDGNLLPFNTTGLPNAGGTSDSLFVAGDIRVNEQVGLMAIQTLFVREHNRLADQIATQNPQWNDEQIYQAARRTVIGEIQSITYNEFLPALLGTDAITPYRGYNPNVNPGIDNLFATAAYRFGHTTLGPTLARLNEDGSESAEGDLALRDSFFRIDQVTQYGIDSLIRGLATQQAQEVDTHIADDVRNFLFGPPGSGGFDLASLNIQRGRDHGLPDYNQARVDLGLPAVTSFAQITSDADLQQSLEEVYGDVNNIDVWVGGLAEDHIPGGSLGPLFTRELVDQFTRIRDGDRFWYENVFRGDQLQKIESTTLAGIIHRNTLAQSVQENAFFIPQVLYHEAQGRNSIDVAIVADQGGVTLLDQVQRRPIESREAGDADRAMIVGSAGRPDRVLVDLTRGAIDLPEGIVVEGGRGGVDVLVVRATPEIDHIQVDSQAVTVNGLRIAIGGLEEIHLLTGPGDDVVQMADGLSFRVMVDPVPPQPAPTPVPPGVDPQGPLMPTATNPGSGPSSSTGTSTSPTPSVPGTSVPPVGTTLSGPASNSNSTPPTRPRQSTSLTSAPIDPRESTLAVDAIFSQLGQAGSRRR